MAHVLDITIDHTKVAADLTDFPILIVPTNAAEWQALYDVATAAGGDIRLFKSDGTTELPREVVSFSVSNETGEIHVKYSGTLSSTVDTVIQVHADGTSSDYAVTDTYGRNAVWTAYELVAHLEGSFLDSTGNGHTEVTNSGRTTGATSKIGKGFDMSGSSSRSMVSGTFPSGATARTLSAWGKPDTTSGNDFLISYGTDAARAMMGISNLGTSSYRMTLNSADDDTGVSYTAGVWHKFAYKYTGTQAIGYVDGVLKTTRTVTAVTGSGNFTIGNYPNQTGVPWDGLIEEVRVMKSAVSDNWETTEYNNQNSPSTFYAVEAVESATPQSVITTAAATADITTNTIFTLAIATAASVTATTNLTKSFLRTIAVTASALAETRTGSVFKKLLDVTASAVTGITTQWFQGFSFSAIAAAGAIMTLQKTFNRTLEATASAATEMQNIKSFIVNMATSAAAAVTLQAAKTFYITMLAAASAATTTKSTLAKTLTIVARAKTCLGDYFYKRKYLGNDEDNDYKRTY